MMTEEEKKAALEASKSRIANAAIKLATAATLATPTPNLSTAHTATQNTSPETTHTVTTATLQKSNLKITDAKDAQNLPAFGSDEWLKSQIRADRTEHETAVAKQTTALLTSNKNQNSSKEHENYQAYEQGYAKRNNLTLDQYRSAQADIAEALSSPCPDATGNFRIGNWGNSSTSISLDETIRRQISPKELPDQPDMILARNGKNKNVTIQTVENTKEGSLAYYSSSDFSPTITLQTFSEEEQKKVKEYAKKNGADKTTEYILNNPYAKTMTALHEANHMIDDQYNGQFVLQRTPLNAACADRLTETKSYAVEYLAAAQLYTSLKKQGIKTTSVNGENRPIESILEMYPGLKETVLEKGFDAKDPTSVRNVVEKASDYWHKNRADGYAKQDIAMAAAASVNFASYTMTEKLELLKNEEKTYKEISEKMLKNTYIGQNTMVDLSGCRDLLDTLDKEQFAENIRSAQESNTSNPNENSNQIDLISYKELSAINTYLESKGLTTDDAKDKYMKTALKNISTRSENQDTELKNLLLSFNNSTMTYADGLNEGSWLNMRIVSNTKGQSFQISDTMLDEARLRLNRQQQLENMPSLSLSFDKMPSITLSASEREDISETMRQDHQNHNTELKTRIESLKSPIKEQPSNTTANTLSPATMIKMQQRGR